MRTVSASMEYKPWASLIPGSPGKHQCGVQSLGLPRSQPPLVSTSVEYLPRASLVPRLPWCAPVRSTSPGLTLLPDSFRETNN